MLATVNEDADRVTRLLGELLDVSRIDAGRLQLRRQMIDAPAHRGARRRAAAPRPTRRPRHRGRDFDDGFPPLYADPDKVEQVLTNLVENALKYGEGRVTVSAALDGEAVRSRSSYDDQGKGIPAQYLEQIFTKFFRRAGERRTGTGLGLYITKGIVEAHGGRIWADERPRARRAACTSPCRWAGWSWPASTRGAPLVTLHGNWSASRRTRSRRSPPRRPSTSSTPRARP